MPTSQARIATPLASRYLPQGRIELRAGSCELVAAAGTLTLRAEAGDPQALAQLEQIVARHLERFAFREQPQLAWAPPA